MTMYIHVPWLFVGDTSSVSGRKYLDKDADIHVDQAVLGLVGMVVRYRYHFFLAV